MTNDSASAPVYLPAIAIDLNRRLLNRYRFVLHASMHLLAGWLPKAERFELKCEMGRMIWESSLHVNACYLRLREVQSPAFQKPDDEALLAVMAAMPHAPDETALLLCYAGTLIPDLIRALENHERATFPNSDLPSVHALRHILLDLRSQRERLQPLLPVQDQLSAATREWLAYIRQLLATAGGVDGLGARAEKSPARPPCWSEFQLPREAGRDDRFTQRGSDMDPLPAEENYADHTLEEFERYSTEMLAAETVAAVLYSLPRMPWEFQFDAARHLYDEVRHCLMGFEWMQRHGLDPFASPQYLQVYRWRSQFPPVTQYCLLTMGNEVHSFPYRHRRVEAHARAGESLSEQFVRYDIADETQHVRFGNRWLPELLEHVGESRPLEQFKSETLEIWNAQYKTGLLPVNVE